MEKNIKDYLHLYIGCEVMAPCMSWDEEPVAKGILTGIHGEYEAEIQFIIDGNAEESPDYAKFIDVKPILRKLDSMTEEETAEFKKLIPWIDFERFLPGNRWRYNEHEETSKHETRVVCNTSAGINTLPMVVVPYLLSKGFDLFGLIDAGLAIDLLPSNLAIDKNK